MTAGRRVRVAADRPSSARTSARTSTRASAAVGLEPERVGLAGGEGVTLAGLLRPFVYEARSREGLVTSVAAKTRPQAFALSRFRR